MSMQFGGLALANRGTPTNLLSDFLHLKLTVNGTEQPLTFFHKDHLCSLHATKHGSMEGKQGLGIAVFWIIAVVLNYSLASPSIMGLRFLATRAQAFELKACPFSNCVAYCVSSSTRVEMVEM